MAAQVLLLLLLLSSNIPAHIIHPPGGDHRFYLDDFADFCSVSQWTTEGMRLLWNSSGSSYTIEPLDVSHSGQYLQQCWTQGFMTLERNSSLLVCDHKKMRVHDKTLYVYVGDTVELVCDGVGPNQSVKWAYNNYRRDGLVVLEDEASSVLQLQLLKNKRPPLSTTFSRTSSTVYCLENNRHSCDFLSQYVVIIEPELILLSVGDSLQLNCSDVGSDERHWWLMFNSLVETRSFNSTLIFPSLTLNHTGDYNCYLHPSIDTSILVHSSVIVCPESDPAVKFFTPGENLTLHCGDWNQRGQIIWFKRTNRTGGRVFDVRYATTRADNMFHSGDSLVITNVSLQDSGHFWCVVKRKRMCLFRSETLLLFGEPEVDHQLLRSVLLVVVMVMMLSVVVAAVMFRRGRKREEQTPAATGELEMSQLSPEVQEETPEL